jgi:hypothetical protein
MNNMFHPHATSILNVSVLRLFPKVWVTQFIRGSPNFKPLTDHTTPYVPTHREHHKEYILYNRIRPAMIRFIKHKQTRKN